MPGTEPARRPCCARSVGNTRAVWVSTRAAAGTPGEPVSPAQAGTTPAGWMEVPIGQLVS